MGGSARKYIVLVLILGVKREMFIIRLSSAIDKSCPMLAIAEM